MSELNKSFHDRTSLMAFLFRSFHESEPPIAFHCFTFICGRAYCSLKGGKRAILKRINNAAFA